MSYDIMVKAKNFKQNTEKFMSISKDLLNAVLKDSMSISYLASIDAESLAMIGKLNDAFNVCEEMLKDFCDLEKEMTEQISKLDKLKTLDSKLDRIEEKLDRLEDNKKNK